MKGSKLKSIIIILSVFVCGEVFSYDWKGRMEIFSYDLANRYENEYFYVLEEYYETFKYRDRNYLTSVMPNFVNTGFWETAFDRYFEWYEIIRIEELGIGIDKNEELLVFTGPYFVIENVEEMTSELLKIETKIPEYSRQFLKVGVLDWNFISDTSAPALLIEIGAMDTDEGRKVLYAREKQLSKTLASTLKSFNKDRPNWK